MQPPNFHYYCITPVASTESTSLPATSLIRRDREYFSARVRSALGSAGIKPLVEGAVVALLRRAISLQWGPFLLNFSERY